MYVIIKPLYIHLYRLIIEKYFWFVLRRYRFFVVSLLYLSSDPCHHRLLHLICKENIQVALSQLNLIGKITYLILALTDQSSQNASSPSRPHKPFDYCITNSCRFPADLNYAHSRSEVILL